RGAPVNLLTANGQTTGFRTRLESLALGEIVLHDVRAIVAPGLGGVQILLGMSPLKQLEFTQRAGTLVLRQHATDRPCAKFAACPGTAWGGARSPTSPSRPTSTIPGARSWTARRRTAVTVSSPGSGASSTAGASSA